MNRAHESTPSVGSSERWATLTSGALAALAISPQLFVYATGAHPLAIANESVAYRYFYSYRASIEDAGRAFLPQGQLVDAAGFVMQWALGGLLDPAQSLERATLLFSWGFFLLNGLVIVAALRCVLVHPKSPVADVLAVWGLTLVGFYASRSGVNALLAPDYYLFEVSLTAFSLGWALSILRAPPRVAPVALLARLGCLAALLATIKVSLVGAAVFPVSAMLYRGQLGDDPRGWLAGALTSVACAVSLTAGIVLAALGGDVSALSTYASGWASFLAAPGGEPGFFLSLLSPWSHGADPGAAYAYALPIALVLALASARALLAAHGEARSSDERTLRAAWLVVPPLLLVVPHVWSVLHRPAGTTLWETAIFASATSLWYLRIEPRDRAGDAVERWIRGAALGVLASVLVVGLPLHLSRIVNVRAFRESSSTIWKIHEAVRSQPDGTLFVVPDNQYTAGTVEEALLKGASDFPTWSIQSGLELLSVLAPGLEIRHSLELDAPRRALLWIEAPEAPSLQGRFPVLAQRAASPDCVQYAIQNWDWRPRTVHLCPAARP